MVIQVIAHVFLSYFISVDVLFAWLREGPFSHPKAFLFMLFVTGLLYFNFSWFREQLCLIICPYGRLQSALIDDDTVVIGYDEIRGEPRGRPKKGADQLGDCIDCFRCVEVCPTGIDIRQGLQMECIGCAQCVDACDAVMDKIDRPRGLIRYSSQDAMAGKPMKLLRGRVVLYPALLVIVLALFSVTLGSKPTADVTLLRNFGTPFAELQSGEISNSMRIKVTNRTDAPVVYRIALAAGSPARIVTNLSDGLVIEPGDSLTRGIVIGAPRDAFTTGRLDVKLVITDTEGHFEKQVECRLLGPVGAAPEDNSTGNGAST